MSIPTMLTARDIAKILHVSYETALAFIRYSGIEYIQIGRQYRVAASKLEAFLLKKGQTTIDITGVER